MDTDPVIEPWRSALDEETLLYTANHYRHGVNNNSYAFLGSN